MIFEYKSLYIVYKISLKSIDSIKKTSKDVNIYYSY